MEVKWLLTIIVTSSDYKKRIIDPAYVNIMHGEALYLNIGRGGSSCLGFIVVLFGN
jgi:hypothetical protein